MPTEDTVTVSRELFSQLWHYLACYLSDECTANIELPSPINEHWIRMLAETGNKCQKIFADNHFDPNDYL